MNAGFIVAVLAVSSVLVWALTGRRRGDQARWRAAGLALCEFAGLWALALIVDVVVGVAVILSVRAATSFFVSVYVLNDVSLAIASALQAFVLYWRRHSALTPAA